MFVFLLTIQIQNGETAILFEQASRPQWQLPTCFSRCQCFSCSPTPSYTLALLSPSTSSGRSQVISVNQPQPGWHTSLLTPQAFIQIQCADLILLVALIIILVVAERHLLHHCGLRCLDGEGSSINLSHHRPPLPLKSKSSPST